MLAALFAHAALAFEPFVVKDIRVEGVQRTEAGTVFNYLPIKVGDRVDDEKASAAVKALYATGFFRDVRLESENGVLVVIVQERPTISQIDITGTKEFDKDTLKKALKDIGIAESRIFDRSALERAEQEFKRQYINRGYYGVKVTTTVTPQERNRVAINFTVEEGEAVEDRQYQHRRRPRLSGKDADQRDAAVDAGLADLVHEERPVFEAEAAGRPGNAAQLLHQPRLSGVRRRFDAGVDHAEQGGHLHHDQHHRGTEVHDIRGAARRRAAAARSRVDAPGPGPPGRRLFARKADPVDQGAVRSTRQRRLRVRQRQCGPRDRPRQAAGGVHLLHRPGPPRIHPAHQHQRQQQDARRGDTPRDAPARRRLVRRGADRALEGSHHPAQLLRRSQHRDAGRPRQPGPGRYRRHRHREIDRQPAGGRRLFQRRRRRALGVDLPEQRFRHGQRAGHRRSTAVA